MEGKNSYIISSGSQSESAESEITIYENPVYLAVKRCFDIVFSLLCIIVFTIPILFVMLLIVIDSPGASPIYIQYRVGKNGRVFKFYKLRSMVPEADQMLDSLLDQNEMEGPAFKISNDPRITRVGRVIRRTCIDELPQLWNILKGDMSFVGPRPPLPREVEQYNDFQRNRLSVVPGLTCYWQIQPNRNSLTFDKWLELDLKYIEERNVKNDLMIIFKTVGAVLNMEGV
ncbi:MAG TPA: multidrug MFS transporter [Ruminococcaceae bacterium]|nr:multidrug MFS transporter [Oscillospiraceae bacterium]